MLTIYRNMGEQRALRFRGKGGNDREIPVRHDLEAWLRDYTAAAGIGEDSRDSAMGHSST